MTQPELIEAEKPQPPATRTRKASKPERFSALGLWFKEQEILDSYSGNNIQDLDFIYENKNTGNYIYMEEKSQGGKLRPWQSQLFAKMAEGNNGKNFRGFWVVWLTGKTPQDGPVSVENIKTQKRYDGVDLPRFMLWVTR
jgi:hypothetical protein